MDQTVIGVFDTYDHAERAKQQLIARGFSANDVQVRAHSADLAGTGTDSTATTTTTTSDHDVGFMDSVRNFFSDLFGPDADDAGHYSEAVRRGGAVVAVTVADESRIDSAREALAATGAVDIEKRVAAWKETGYQGYRADAAPYTRDEVAQERSRVIPVVQEDLEVGKRQVDLGAVRVVSRLVETPVNESVTLREEHANIERRPVDRPVSEADLANFREESIEVRETAEKAVVSKTARVVEEVTVGKTATEHTEQVSDTVRSTVVDVQNDGTSTAAGTTGGMMGTTGGTTGGMMDTTGGTTAGTMGTTGGTTGGMMGTTGGTTAGMLGAAGGVTGGMMGTTADNMGATRTSADYDDDFRSDWNTRYAATGGSYDDYAPAYRYGSTLGADTRYKGRSWDEVESGARSDWQTRYPNSSWDNFKAAVRHGWERVSGQR
jgi:uncharacterized protein (TIGR02271 family)